MTIEGIYGKTLFRNNKTGFTVFILKLLKHDDDGNKIYKCRGVIPNYANKTPLKLEGQIFKTETGPEFTVVHTEININSDALLHSYILSNLGPGMGNACADRLISYLKINNLTLDELLQKDNAIDILCSIKGYEKKKAIVFLRKIQESVMQLKLLNDLSLYGISFQQVNKLYSLYQKSVRNEIKENPYRSMRMAKIPFNNADAYAKDIGYTYCDPDRITELVSKTYYYLATTGNSYCTFRNIISIFRKVEKMLSCFDEIIPESLVLLELLSNKNGYIDFNNGEPLFYTKQSWEAENSIVGQLERLMCTSTEFLTENDIEEYLKTEGSSLDESQKESFSLLKTTAPSFLIGGPGTGKTTTIKSFVACVKKYYPDKIISICAPSGRAAERIKEATGFHAMTVHLFLEYRMEDGYSYPLRNSNNQVESDFIIIDEFSMVGIYLFSNFLNAVPDGTKLLFVGDWNQLPSVEPGFLLHDLVNSSCFPYYKLTNTHRQSADSSIHVNADKILAGDISLKTDNSFNIHRFRNNAEAKMFLKDILLKYYDKTNFQNFHIIIPKRSGILGVDEVNLFAQEIFHNTSEPCLCYGNNIFYEEDKVITTRNCYDEDNLYFNGDLWTVIGMKGNDSLTISNGSDYNLEIAEDNLDDVSLAYATTIHKYQGSESNIILIILPDDIPKVMITRSLLYTGITRAKQKTIIISVGNMLEQFIASDIHTQRNSGILRKIEKSNLRQYKK